MKYRDFVFLIFLTCLAACANNTTSEEYNFPPVWEDVSYMLLRSDGITGDTLSTRLLNGVMFEDGLFLDSDTGYFDTVTFKHVMDESKEFIEIFISNRRGNRTLEIEEYYKYMKKTTRNFSSDYPKVQYDSVESIVSYFKSNSQVKFYFDESTILFDFVFDGKPSNFELIMLELKYERVK